MCSKFALANSICSAKIPEIGRKLVNSRLISNYEYAPYIHTMHQNIMYPTYIHVTGPAKIIYHMSTEKLPVLLYHNVRTICTNNLKSLLLLQNLMGFLLKFTEMAYHIQN